MNVPDTSGPRELPFSGLFAFEATARLGSMSAAADELNLTRSVIRRRVARLEEFVGQAPFLRRDRGVVISGAGEQRVLTVTETLRRPRLRTGLHHIEPCRNRDSLLLACPLDVARGWRLSPRTPFANLAFEWPLREAGVPAAGATDRSADLGTPRAAHRRDG